MSLLFPSSSPPGPDRRLPEGKRQVPVVGWRSWKLRRARDGVLLQSVVGSDCCPANPVIVEVEEEEVMFGHIRRVALALSSAGALAVGIAAAGASPVSADYGSGAQFQVEISGNAPGVGIWLWAELGPNQTSDYQETDCIHLGGGSATDGALHDSGSLTSWSVSNGTLTMNGMKVLGGLETAAVSAPIGANRTINSVTITITSAIVPIIPVGASLTLPAAGVVAP